MKYRAWYWGFSVCLFIAGCGGGGTSSRVTEPQILPDSSHLATNCQYADRSNFKGTIVLPPACLYQQNIRITESNTSLDCNGSVFDGKGQDHVGLYIDSQGEPLSNVTIKNCTFRNFKGGVRVAWSGVDSEKLGSREELYRNSPTRVLLDHVTVDYNNGVGIYVDDYVTNVTIRNSLIRDNKGAGIYLEHSSKQNHIANNRLIRNGYRVDKGPREAIAVDSSAENRIENNHFDSNAAGAIFLYKNCSEHISSGKQVIRWQHSNNNVIRDNRFTNEEIGVWLASRQSRDLSKWDCGDTPMDPQGRYFEDFASHNEVSSNHFSRIRTAVRIESDYNTIADNTFECTGNPAVEFPRTMREIYLRRPQIGNLIERNQDQTCG